MQSRLLCATLLLAPLGAFAQSTFGTILGTVRDPSGSVISKASVRVTNLDENTSRTLLTDDNGAFEAVNSKPGRYSLTASSPGFRTATTAGLQLQSRQTMRVDLALEVGQVDQAINVEASAGLIATDTQTVASDINTEKILTLPGNIRASGSTSPYKLISVLPGVQADNGDSFSIQGALPAQSQSTIDGISAQHVRNNEPLKEIFPSVESIAEIKVQGVGNNAEYGAVGDITTISKSGTNDFHGAGFWYHQNRALDAKAYGATSKPQKVANDFGFTLGGPVYLPRLYHGQNRTFFFGTYEDFRYPRGSTIQNTVPTDAVRQGNFSAEAPIKDPLTGQQFPGNVIPDSRISPVAKKFLSLYPSPNYGSTAVVSTPNFVTNRASNIDSRQYDVRVDHYINSKQSLFVRWSSKDITRLSPNDLLLPSTNNSDENRSLVVSHNYTITPHLINEFRFGLTREKPGANFAFDGRAFAQSLGLHDIGPFPFNGLPDLSIDNFTGVGVDRVESLDTYRTIQANNNTTWTVGRHTIKFGFDFRSLRSKTALGFIGADNYGNFSFGGGFTGNSFADFLLGLPGDTSYGNVQQDNDGTANQYHAYIQDSFRVSRSLTLEYGVRYEYHPPFQDASGNIGNFDRSVPVTGRVIYPSSEKAAKLLAPGLLLSVNACPGTPNLPAAGPGIPGVPCTPFVTAAQAGLPEGLRKSYKAEFFPRVGFAYRFGGGNTTVVRGGAGIYNMAVLGAVFYSLTGTAQTDVRTFNNISPTGSPLFQWPDTRTGGSGVTADAYGNAYFGTANAIDFHNPHAAQWNLSVDRALGWETGLRLSYIGLRSWHLPYAPNLNQSQPSTEFFASQPLTNRPFPYWLRVESRDTGAVALYQSFQTEVNRRFRAGLTFNGAYTLAKNLSDTGGPAPTGFSGETGGGRIMDSLNRHGNYGEVYATRRHRFISTALYELPVGKGKHFLTNAHPVVNGILGGWRLSTILLIQSGPYLTPYFSSGVGDPSGSGSGFYRDQRPDRIASGSLPDPTRNLWLDRSAFVCPGRTPGPNQFNCSVGRNPATDPAPIGRFGNSGIGIATGPGTFNLSAGLGKNFSLTERVVLKMEGSFTNVPNHVNLADPEMRINNNAFGRISTARGSEFGGSRTGQVSMRVEF